MVYTIQSSKRFRGYLNTARAFLSKLVPGSIYVRGGGARLTVGFARFHRSFTSTGLRGSSSRFRRSVSRESGKQISHRRWAVRSDFAPPVGSVLYEQTVCLFTHTAREFLGGIAQSDFRVPPDLNTTKSSVTTPQ